MIALSASHTVMVISPEELRILADELVEQKRLFDESGELALVFLDPKTRTNLVLHPDIQELPFNWELRAGKTRIATQSLGGGDYTRTYRSSSPIQETKEKVKL